MITARNNLRTQIAHVVQMLDWVKTATDTYGGEYDDHIRADHWTDIYEAVYNYLTSSESITKYRNDARKAVVNNFPPAFYSGYADESGGSETEDDDEAWLTKAMNEALTFVDEMFSSLKDKRGQEGLEADAEASTRADGYRGTLDTVYSQGKLRGAKNQTLEFDGDDGEESCTTCVGLKGKRRTIKWILENDMIPGPGNENFVCNGYKCQHFWKNPKTGERYTF